MVKKKRRILFRGKSVKTGQWHFGAFCDEEFCDTDFCTIIPRLDDDVEDDDWEVVPETVGQYTGIHDCDGKRIFEGDILECRYDEDDGEDVVYAIVEWYASGWTQRQGIHHDELLEEDTPYIKVAGNRWDDQKLLKEAGA